MAIRGFRHKGLAELFVNGATRRITRAHHKRIIEMLDILNAATATKDLTGVRDFHPLKGGRRGAYSMHVNGPWCLTFKLKDGDVLDIDYENYHS